MKPIQILALLLLFLLPIGPLQAQSDANEYREDAQQLIDLVQENYAYLDRFENGRIPLNERLQAEANAVSDDRSLLLFAERLLFVLRDHHAITGSSFSDSWAIVPSYADLWIVHRNGTYFVDAVQDGSPAERAGILPGMRLTGIGGEPIAEVVEALWSDLGDTLRDADSLGFAARVLAAGRRDRPRLLDFEGTAGAISAELPSMYDQEPLDQAPVNAARDGDRLIIRFNNSLGDAATIAAFDSIMAEAGDAQTVMIDLTDTPGGGNTVVARAIMGWFVDRPSPYQIHNLPAEQRATGIARQWVEYVLPRDGKHFAGAVTVLVGRWTGSMGEGLATGLQAQGAVLEGHDMAGLRGAVYDLRTNNSGLLIKLPVERLYTVGAIPREAVVIE